MKALDLMTQLHDALTKGGASKEWADYVIGDLMETATAWGQHQWDRGRNAGERDGMSRARNRPGDGDMGG